MYDTAEPVLDYDYLIIGSGFGGSTAALRLVEKGWKVGLVEQGRRISAKDIEAGKNSPRKMMWNPDMGMRGYFAQYFFRHMFVVAGVGLGGGSIVWASVMLEPKAAFYDAPVLKKLGLNFKQDLAPYFATAKRMLGVNRNQRLTQQDNWLKSTASAMGAGQTFSSIDNAIYFGMPGVTVEDPYFNGAGPSRAGCIFCGGCVTGCPHNAKNSLDRNYLYLAERKGLNIIVETEADRITPLPNRGYRVETINPLTGKHKGSLTTRKVVLSCGVLGTLRLLFKNRDTYRSLPDVSALLGKDVRTNSEAFSAVLHERGLNVLDGTAISSHFYPNSHTHITNNRFDRGLRSMRTLFVPLVGGGPVAWRAVKTLLQILARPGLFFDNLFGAEWEKRLTVMTTMQDSDGVLELVYRRRWWWPIGKTLQTRHSEGQQAPTFISEANAAAQYLADISGGRAMSCATETLAGMSNTAHILGGCSMGLNAADGVIDANHEMHGYPGLFVCDGSSIPANIGVNPSLTITALAERFAALQPEKSRT